MKDYIKEIKMMENGLVIIILSIIIIILLPLFRQMIDKSKRLAAETYTIRNIEMVKEIYTLVSLNDEVNLPFKVVYNNDGYKVYINGKEYTKLNKLNIEAIDKYPTDGNIEIDLSGKIIVKDVKFGNYKCNSEKDDKVICEK